MQKFSGLCARGQLESSSRREGIEQLVHSGDVQIDVTVEPIGGDLLFHVAPDLLDRILPVPRIARQRAALDSRMLREPRTREFGRVDARVDATTRSTR